MPPAIDANIQAAYQRALARRGRWVTFRRVGGNAPNSATFDATVLAIIENYVPEKPVLEVEREGAITQGARRITALQDDLARKHFPLPVAKNDKVIVADDVEFPSRIALAGGEVLNVMSIDPFKRALAGAIEIMAVGV